MFIFKKFSKNLKRTVSGALCLIVLSSLLVVPAGALDVIGNFSTALSSSDGWKYATVQMPSNGGYQSQILNSSLLNSFDVSLRQFAISPNKRLSGVFSAYFSCYFYASGSNVSISSPDLSPNNFYLQFVNTDNAITEVNGGIDISPLSITPSDGFSYSKGYAFKIRTYLEDTMLNISRVNLVSASETASQFSFSSSSPFQVSYCVPSVVFIVSESATDLDALEGIADSIITQSQAMSAYYGDIMQLLNDLYSRLGDLESVQETANSYFSQLIPLINSLSTNTANIHSLLQTQFQLLRTLIATESDDIQAAIEKQTDDLIAYFDTVFSDAVGDMPEKTDDLNQSVGDVSDAESNYQSTATQRFDQLTDTFSGGFSGGTLAGVTLAATLFTRVWNALGDYVIVYTWPLFLGLCLVILGRMSRLSGGQSSSEKHRGDSDA